MKEIILITGGARICVETGKLANEFCPNVEEKAYTIKPPKEEKGKWTSDYGGRYGNSPTETCTVHTKPEETPKPAENNTTSGGNTVTPPPANNTTSGGNTVTPPPAENNTTSGGNTVTPPPAENTTGGNTTPEE